MKKTFFISFCILLIVTFLSSEAISQNANQASLNENGKIVLEEASLEIYKYSVDISSLNLGSIEDVETYFAKINESQYFKIEVISITEVNLTLVRRNIYGNAFWDVNEWNQLLNTL